MATYTTNFSSWSGFEALLTATNAFEFSPAFEAIESDIVALESALFYASPIYPPSRTDTSITATYYGYPNYITAHITGTNFLGSNPVVTRAEITNGIYTLVMAGSINVGSGTPVGTITSIDFSGQGYAQHGVGRMPLDGSAIVFTSWSSTLPTAMGSVSFAFTGTDTVDSSGNETIAYSKIIISDAFGHSASISGFSHSISVSAPGTVDYVALLHDFLGENDIASGGAGGNELRTFAGDDTLDGKAGADTMAGGDGNDTYLVDDAGDLVVENPDEGNDLVKSSASHVLADNVENLILTGTANIAGTGNLLANAITGNSSNNALAGGGGDDTLLGGAGADAMSGGTGNDTYVVDNIADSITENSDEGSDSVQSSVTYSLAANVETLLLTGVAAINGTGNDLDNILTGNVAVNVLNGGIGADTMAGGDGADTYVVDDSGDLVTETNALAAGGSDLVQAAISYKLGDNLEKLTLTGTAAIDGRGNDLANVLTGNTGSNRLDGGLGADTLIGGLGDDVFIVESTADVVTELAGGGDDSVLVKTALTTGSFVMGANVEYGALSGADNLNLTGNAANNGMLGNNGANVLDGGLGNDVLYAGGGNDTLMGGAGDDLLDGRQGSDRMEGGAGNDSYYVNRGDGAGTAITANEDTVVELAAGGTDTVYSAVYTYTLDANVENLVLQSGNLARKGFGNAGDNAITGNGLNNSLSGDAGNDTLNGGAGNDSLSGGIGNDRLDGGLGRDAMSGGAGNDSFAFSTALNATTNTDIIADFSTGLDSIVLSNAVFTALGAAGSLNASYFHAGTSALDADDHIIFDVSTGALYYDPDGMGGADQVLFATLAGASALAASDIAVGI
jgi:Ca2+-binding RTX toxin-like protein